MKMQFEKTCDDDDRRNAGDDRPAKDTIRIATLRMSFEDMGAIQIALEARGMSLDLGKQSVEGFFSEVRNGTVWSRRFDTRVMRLK